MVKIKNKITVLKHFIFLTLFCITCFPCGAFAGQTIENADEGYQLYLPQRALAGKTVSVLIAFPGNTVPSKTDISNWTFAAEKNDLAVIDFDMDYNHFSHTDTQDRIKRAVEELSQKYPLEKEFLLIAGTSAGGMLSMELALKFPKTYRAIGVVSAGRLSYVEPSTLPNARGQLFFMAHGTKDDKIHIEEFQATKAKLEENGGIIQAKIVPFGVHQLPSSAYKQVVDWMAEHA